MIPATGAIQDPARRGYMLAEALCALALAGLLAVSAALSLGSARRAMASADRLSTASTAAREAVTIIAALLADADSIRIEGDTAVRLAIVVAVGAACDISGPNRNVILLPPVEVEAGNAFTARTQAIEVGDIATVLVVDSLGQNGQWVRTVVDSVGKRTATMPCGAADGWGSLAMAGAARQRLVLRDALPSAAAPGAPVRINRVGRLALYSAGNGDWMLGWRRCNVSACGAVQPVTGPLRTPGAGGLRFVVDSAASLIEVRASGALPSRPAHLTVRPTNGL